MARTLTLWLVIMMAGCNALVGSRTPTLEDGGAIDAPESEAPIDASVDATGDGGVDATVDASVDARVATRRAELLVADISVTTPSAGLIGLRGGVVRIEVTDLSHGDGTRVYGDALNVGTCIVDRFDAAHPAGPLVDAGQVAIGGTGVKKPLGTCSATGGKYACVIRDATASASATATTVIRPGQLPVVQVTYAFTGTDLDTLRLVGAHLTVGGYADTRFNGTFPVVSHTNGQVTVVPRTPPPTSTSAPSTSVRYRLVAGQAPVPTSGEVDASILGTGTVTITKAADPGWGAIDVSATDLGAGLVLKGTRPHAFPTRDEAATYECDAANNGCAPGAMFLVGITTDADLTGTANYDMPEAIGAYTRFKCAGLSSITIPQAAVHEILATHPKRVQVLVLRGTGNFLVDGLNSGIWAVGHGQLGHTTMP